MSDKQEPIEQLYYTWSTVGLDRAHTGERLRAASEGIEVGTQEVLELEQFRYYELPKGIDARKLLPGQAPTGLALISTPSGRRALVQKVYADKDLINRTGVSFVHIYANLPDAKAFSPLEAIKLWRSPLFEQSDSKLSLDTLRLERETLKKIKAAAKRDIHPGKLTRIRARAFLPYIIAAFLLKNDVPQRKTGALGRQKIYIAAHDEDIAYFIFALLSCLPENLTKEITFSTYEHRPEEAAVEIVGTCWVPDYSGEENLNLFPSWYYQPGQRLAVNCYTNESTPLENNPLVAYDPRALDFANDALGYLENKQSGAFDFRRLLEEANEYSDLTATKFLDLYDIFRKPATKENIQALFKDPSLAIGVLRWANYRQTIISLAIDDLSWWRQNGFDGIVYLHRLSGENVQLAESLHLLAQDVLIQMPLVARSCIAPGPEERPADKIVAFKNLFHLLGNSTSNAEKAKTWRELLKKLSEVEHIFEFFQRNWDIYSALLLMLTYDTKTTSLLAPYLKIPWTRFGDFLGLELPLPWCELAIMHLVTIPLPVEVGRDLAVSAGNRVDRLFDNLLQIVDQTGSSDYRSTSIALFDVLARGAYPEKLRTLFTILGTSLGSREAEVGRVLDVAQLTGREPAVFLKKFGKTYLISENLAAHIKRIFSEMVISDDEQRVETWSILTLWLADAELSLWFTSTNIGVQCFNFILSPANLTVTQIAEFYRLYADTYLPHYVRLPILLNIFRKVVDSQNSPQKLAILDIIVRRELERGELEDWLRQGHLLLFEKAWFLEKYGSQYLSWYSGSQLLLEYAEEYMQAFLLQIDDYPHLPARKAFQDFLLRSTLRLPSLQRLRDLQSVLSYSREPDLEKEAQVELAETMARLDNDELIAKETRAKLWLMLMRAFSACIEDVIDLQSLIDTMSKIKNSSALLQFIYDLACEVTSGIQARKYPKDYLLPYVQLAFRFQSILFLPDLATESKQEFVSRLLGLLIMNQEIISLISSEAKYWPDKDLQQWRKYVGSMSRNVARISQPSQPSQPPLPAPRERKSLRLRHPYVYYTVNGSLKKGSIADIVSVDFKFSPVLDTYSGHLPARWEEIIDAALDFYIAERDFEARERWEEREKAAALVEAYDRIQHVFVIAKYRLKLTENERMNIDSARKLMMQS